MNNRIVITIVITAIITNIVSRIIWETPECKPCYADSYTLKKKCDLIGKDLCVLKGLNDTIIAYNHYSKANTMQNKRIELERYVNEYNEKSECCTRFTWNNDTLPYKLSVNNYKCY